MPAARVGAGAARAPHSWCSARPFLPLRPACIPRRRNQPPGSPCAWLLEGLGDLVRRRPCRALPCLHLSLDLPRSIPCSALLYPHPFWTLSPHEARTIPHPAGDAEECDAPRQRPRARRAPRPRPRPLRVSRAGDVFEPSTFFSPPSMPHAGSWHHRWRMGENGCIAPPSMGVLYVRACAPSLMLPRSWSWSWRPLGNRRRFCPRNAARAFAPVRSRVTEHTTECRRVGRSRC